VLRWKNNLKEYYDEVKHKSAYFSFQNCYLKYYKYHKTIFLVVALTNLPVNLDYSFIMINNNLWLSIL